MRDPVCGMTVGKGALTVDGYPEYGFCSEHCRQAFTADPDQYLGEAVTGETEDPAEEGEAVSPRGRP